MYRSARFALALAFAAAAAPAWAQTAPTPTPTTITTPVQSKLSAALIMTVAERKPGTLETRFRNISLKQRDLAARIYGLLSTDEKTALGAAQNPQLVFERLTRSYSNDADRFSYGPVKTWLVNGTGKGVDITARFFDGQAIVLGLPDAQLLRRRPQKSVSGALQVLPDLTLAQGIIEFPAAPIDPNATVGAPLLPLDNYLTGVLAAQQNLNTGVSTGAGVRVALAARKNKVTVQGAVLFDLNGEPVKTQPTVAIVRGSLGSTAEKPVAKPLDTDPFLAPIADAGAPQSAVSAANVTVTLLGTVTPVQLTEPNQPPATIELDSAEWTQISGPPVALAKVPSELTAPTAAFSTGTAPPPAGTKLVFQLAATDALGASAVDTVTVTIGAPTAPTANAGLDKSVDRGTAVALAGSGTDPDGGAVTFAWAQTTPATPAITLTGATTATPSFTAPAVTADTDFTFTLTVKDNENVTATDTVVIKVLAKDPPIARPIATPSSVAPGGTVQLTSTGSSDPDGGNLKFAWTQISPPSPQITLQNTATATANFIAPTATPGTTFVFRLTVTDDEEKTATADVTVSITAPPAGSTPAQR